MRIIKEPWPTFHCQIKGQDVRIKTKHMHALTIELGATGLSMTGIVRLWINDKKIPEGPIPDSPISVNPG